VLSCTLNIAINLYGERFLMALLSDPEAAEHDARVITDTIISLHRLFRSRIPSELAVLGAASIRFMPPGGGLIDGCATQLLSAATYRKLIAPYDNRLMDIYPTGCLMHLCGASEQHIPTFREMPKLKAVQLNDRATEAFEQYYAGLREDQILYVIPTANVSIESVLRVSNGGKRIVIVADTPRNSN